MHDLNPNPMFSRSIDRLKESFLLATAQGGNAEDCESLLSIGADVNWRGQDDETPLLAACKKGHIDVAMVLLAYGADCNARGADSLTALHVAARRGDQPLVNLLLNHNANVNVKNSDGKTAFDVAKAKGYDDVCQRIVMHRHNPATSQANSSVRATSYSSTLAESKHGSESEGGNRAQNSNVHRIEQKVTGNATLTLEAAAMQGQALSSSSSSLDLRRPSSKAQDKRTDSFSSASQSAGPLAAPKDYAFSPSLGAINDAAGTRSSGNGMGQASVDHTSYILELQASLSSKASEAEVLRVQLEEELISAHVTEKENIALKEQLLALKEHLLECTEELALLRGEPEGLRELTTVSECDKVERYLKASLARVEEHKLGLINKMVSENLEDSRMCVVCQTNEKSVVLLPCRHVCVCKECANNEMLLDCPLCRERIRDRIAVFM